MGTLLRTETHDTGTRLSGRTLVIARLIASVLALFSLLILAVTFPVYFAMLQKTCVGATVCSPVQLSPQVALFLLHIGISLRNYALLDIAITSVSMSVWFGVAIIIILRKSDDWMGLLVALMLIVQGTSVVLGYLSSNLREALWLFVSQNAVNYLAFLLLFLVFCLFPNGRYVPRWTRWLVLGWMIVNFCSQFQLIFTPLLALLISIVSFTFLVVGVCMQVYRYLYSSTAHERQQTKWILFGIAIVTVLETGLFIANLLLPQNVILSLLLVFGGTVQILIPLSFGAAILRSHLWDIDVIINRTLVYGLLTAVIGAIYISLLLLLQILLQNLFGKNNDIAIVISTLVVVALFQPLRQAIQRGIDRRFYRRKYDMAHTIEAFSEVLRSEVDLLVLTEHLIHVVDETMQPTHMSLWLCKPDVTKAVEENVT